jgi:hypothetical protein
MIERRTIVCLSLLCALALSALAAPSAMATKGTTAFTCVKVAKGAQFSDAHCTKEGSGEGFKHDVIEAGQKTEITLTNKGTKNSTAESTPAVLGFMIGSMPGSFVCSSVLGEGTLTNNAGPPMNVSGTVTTTFSECSLVAPETFPGCQLENSTVVSKASISSPTEAMELEFKEDGEAFVTFKLTKCKSEAFNITYQFTGSYTAIPNGATWQTTVESTKGLKSTGHQASLETQTTVTMSGNQPGISLTTTES